MAVCISWRTPGTNTNSSQGGRSSCWSALTADMPNDGVHMPGAGPVPKRLRLTIKKRQSLKQSVPIARRY